MLAVGVIKDHFSAVEWYNQPPLITIDVPNCWRQYPRMSSTFSGVPLNGILLLPDNLIRLECANKLNTIIMT